MGLLHLVRIEMVISRENYANNNTQSETRETKNASNISV
jgi:hypothetical protein